MNKNTEICPSCGKNEGYLMGTGQNFILYYNCYSCGHNFLVDATEFIQDEISEQEKLQLIKD
jgi:ssDNA-binding Zn-finger/Zn-ribbon topoisomerase 1